MSVLSDFLDFLFIISVMPFGEFVGRLGYAEATAIGVGWEEYPTMLWLLLDIVIYLVLYGYLTNVVPGSV